MIFLIQTYLSHLAITMTNIKAPDDDDQVNCGLKEENLNSK